MNSEFAKLEHELAHVGFIVDRTGGVLALRGPLNWKENVAFARVRAGKVGRRYFVRATRTFNADGWSWTICPYPPEDPRAMFTRKELKELFDAQGS